MRSSTSSSKSGAPFYPKRLIGICALLIVALEFYSDFLLKHRSEAYPCVSRQYAV
jgi:hypothetical protein